MANAHKPALALRVMSCLMALAAMAFTGAASALETKVAGKLTGVWGPNDYEEFDYSCTGEPVCVGTFTYRTKLVECDNFITGVDRLTISGLNLATPGQIQGTLTFDYVEYNFIKPPNRICSQGGPGVPGSASVAFTASWNASGTGSLEFPTTDDLGRHTTYRGSFKADRLDPVFPLTVTANIGPVVSQASAAIRFRPQDVGTNGSVYVFAVAPATQVQGALALKAAARTGLAARGAPKDTPVQCVIAQLNSAGQLQAVSPSNLQAAVSGTLSAQGQTVSILNNTATANVAGATFFVGYGPNAQAMYNQGINRSAITVPAPVQCKPEKPQTGWWWNPQEDGRGYSIEVTANRYFFAGFLYDVTGRSTWVVSTGDGATLDGALINGQLLEARAGQTLGGAYPGGPRISTLGPITLAFSDASHGTMVWPGGTVPIERFNIIPNGLNLPPVPNQPETGWWWNPEESGRGFFMEFQDATLDIAGYMYDDQGNPVWYLTVSQIAGPGNRNFNERWWSYANGMPLMGPWRPHARVNDNVAPVTITFTGADTALMTLPNGRTTNLRRHRF